MSSGFVWIGERKVEGVGECEKKVRKKMSKMSMFGLWYVRVDTCVM